MGYELDKLMKRFGVSTATVPQYSGVKAPSETVIPDTKNTNALTDVLKAKPKYYTAPVAPTTPTLPTKPDAFTLEKPTQPVKYATSATTDEIDQYNKDNAQYLADLNSWNTQSAAATKAGTDYTASLKAYPTSMTTYNTSLDKYNTDKSTWDALQRKYDIDQAKYSNYVDEYKNRIANTPQYDPLPQGVVQTRPNTSMGQTSIPVTTPPVTQAINNADISSWVNKNPYATTQDIQNYQNQNDLTNRDLYNATGSFYGNQLNSPTYAMLPSITQGKNFTSDDQLNYTKNLLSQGYTAADILKASPDLGTGSSQSYRAMTLLDPNNKLYQSVNSGNIAAARDQDEINFYESNPDQYQSYSSGPTTFSKVGAPPPKNQPIAKFTSNRTGEVYPAYNQQHIDFYKNQYPNGYTETTELAKGGSVHHLARKYAVGGGIVSDVMPNPEEGVPQPAPVATQPAPQQDDRMAQLQSMMEKYATPQNDYAQELEDARRKSNTETEAFTDMIRNAHKSPERDNMSQAERYFRLAAAFGQPTKTGSLGETLGNVGQAMAENEKSKKDIEDQDLELQMKAQQMKAAGAKEDLGTLRALSSEDKKMQREMVSSMIKAEIESGKPQSELAKIAKDRYGYGTPEYYSFLEKNVPTWVASKMAQMQMGPINAQGQLAVAQGNLALNQERTSISQNEYAQKTEDREEKKNLMTNQELKMKTDLQDQINTLENASDTLNRAYKLNRDSFGNTPMEQVKRKELELTVGDKDPKVKNTRELETFLGTTVLDMAQDLKGSISDSDTKMLQSMTGAKALGTEERADILHKNWSQIQKNLLLKKKQLNDVISKRARSYDENASEQ